MWRSWLVCISLLLVCTPSVFSQNLGFKKHWVSDGLPSSETYGVFQDSRGYIWIRTDQGLFRSNGRTLSRVYSKVAGVYALNEDNQGQIWASFSDGSLIVVSPKLEVVEVPKHHFKSIFKADHPYFYDLKKHENGGIWAIYSEGVLKVSFVRKRFTFRHFTSDTNQKEVLISKNETLLINGPVLLQNGKRNQLYLEINNEVDSFRKGLNLSKLSPKFDWRTLMVSFGESIIINSVSELIEINQNGKATVHEMPGRVIDLHVDKQGGLWVGLLKHGLIYFNKTIDSKKGITSLENLSVSGFSMDMEGGVWASTLEKGLFRCPNIEARWFKEPALKERINWIQSVNNSTFVSALTRQLFELVGDSLKVHQLPFQTKDFQCTSILESKPGEYILSAKGFLKRFKPATSVYSDFLYHEKPSGLAIDQVFEDHDSNLFGIYKNTLWSIKNNRISIYHKSEGAAYKWAILWPDSTIRIASDHGLWTFQDGKLYRDNRLNALDSIHITHQISDPSGNVWFSTKGNGLWQWDGKTLHHVSALFESFPKVCHQSSVDTQGNVWVASSEGLGCLSRSKTAKIAFTLFNETAGLPTKELTQVSSIGRWLYCGTSEGLAIIPHSSLLKPKPSMPIYLIEKKTTGPWPANMSLKANQKDVWFKVDFLQFSGNTPSEVLYSLEGLNTQLLQSSGGEIRFASLPPGKFTLKIWEKKPAKDSRTNLELTFQIDKPFFQKLWFLVFTSVCVTLLVVMIVKWQVTKARRKSDEKNETARQMLTHQLTALQAQMNPHFIFNAINSIQQYILKNQQEEAYRYLTRFSQLIRKVLNQSSEQEHSLEEEIEIIKLYIGLEQLRFEKRFKFELIVDEHITLSDIQVPPLLLQPYVENAIWHGLMPLTKEEQGLLWIKIQKINQETQIIIEDNGVGRQASSSLSKIEHKSKGLMFNQKRLELQNELKSGKFWKLSLSDRDEGGTRVLISFIENG